MPKESGIESEKSGTRCRLVVQQCIEAKLKSDIKTFEPLKIGRGIVVYVCFFKEASNEILPSAVKALLNAKIIEETNEATGEISKQKLADFSKKCDILLVPQATLGGKLKGSTVQYHNNIEKSAGELLFDSLKKELILSLESSKNKNCSPAENKSNVYAGPYGGRQILSMDTNGPSTHLFEI